MSREQAGGTDGRNGGDVGGAETSGRGRDKFD